jgi:AcrR family transcriptional regulator
MGKVEQTKQRIITQSAVVFNKQGVEATSIDDIIASAGISRRGFYKHFESKEELSYSVVEYLLDQNISRILDATKAGSVKKKLFRFLDLYRNPAGTGPVPESYQEGGCPVMNFGLEADDTNHTIQGKVELTIKKTLDLLTVILKSGQSSGELGADFNATAFSLKIFSAIKGGMLVSRVLKDDSYMDSIIAMLREEINALEQ